VRTPALSPIGGRNRQKKVSKINLVPGTWYLPIVVYPSSSIILINLRVYSSASYEPHRPPNNAVKVATHQRSGKASPKAATWPSRQRD